MITVIVRCLIIYIIALLIIRIMGKRQIAQMQPFELVITLIIADLATVPMSDVSIPLVNGIVPLVVLAILHFIITFISCKCLRSREFFNGKPVILVDQNGIIEDALKKLNVNINDILEACRYAGYTSLADVQFVIMETNGNISIIPNCDNTPVTREDLKIKGTEPVLPSVIISDGKYSSENMKLMGLDKETVDEYLKSEKTTAKEVIIMSYSQDGEILLQIRGQKIKEVNKKLSPKGGTND